MKINFDTHSQRIGKVVVEFGCLILKNKVPEVRGVSSDVIAAARRGSPGNEFDDFCFSIDEYSKKAPNEMYHKKEARRVWQDNRRLLIPDLRRTPSPGSTLPFRGGNKSLQ